MKYHVTVAGHVVEVDLSGPEPLVDGVTVPAEIVTLPGTSVRHLILGSRSHTVLARAGRQPGHWTVSIRGASLDVEVLDERSRAILQMAGAAETPSAKTVHAPMPGLVVRISVEAGEAVTAGQGILVVEAMKMENELRAPADGIVARIEVAPGQAVEKGAVLVVLE